MFNGLFFDSERYDLSSVGRVKMNMRLEQETDDDQRVLRKEDVIAVLKVLVGLRDGRGEIDDIDNLGNRRSARWASFSKTNIGLDCCAWSGRSRSG